MNRPMVCLWHVASGSDWPAPNGLRLRFGSIWPKRAGQSTVENYLGRDTKARILEVVHEARGDEAAERIAHLKKADMAQVAERLLEGSS